MRILPILAAFIGLTSASTTLHYAPPTLLLATTTNTAATQQQLRDQLPATREYHNQGHQGFYSYGYSGDSSAKAEYKSIDGSSIGFYSYVDSNGQLQTVKYIANRQHGFQAAATNLPKAPVDNRVGPEQIKDTPEVEEARRAHLEAYRVDELRAASAERDDQQQQQLDNTRSDQDNGDAEAGVGMSSIESIENERRRADDQKYNDNQSNEVRVLNLGIQNQKQDGEVRNNGQDERLRTLDIQNGLLLPTGGSSLAQSHLGNTVDLNLLYTNGRELSYLNPYATQYAALHPTAYNTVQLPTQSYYSVLAPRAVAVAPRLLTTLPRLQGQIATTYGNGFPLNLGTTYLSQATYLKK